MISRLQIAVLVGCMLALAAAGFLTRGSDPERFHLQIDEVEDHLYAHNSSVTGHRDGQNMGFVMRDEAGRLIAVAAGYTWAGASELKQMWVDKAHRGRGHAWALLTAYFRPLIELGLAYVDSWSLKLDFLILLRTTNLLTGGAGAV